MKKIISLITLIILVTFMIAGCGGVKSEAKMLRKNYVLPILELHTEYMEDINNLIEDFAENKLTHRNFLNESNKLTKKVLNEVDDVLADLEKEKVKQENKKLYGYALEFTRAYKYFLETWNTEMQRVNRNSKQTMQTLMIIIRNDVNNFNREYNRITGDNIPYVKLK